MAWARAADLLSYIGSVSASAYLPLANTMITTYANRTESASAAISSRDLFSLKLATCYQAAWLPGQPDILTRVNVESSTVDGESVRFASDAQQNLAPQAARALKNLSWKGSRTLRLRDSAQALGRASTIDFTSEASDESSDWSDH